MPGTLLQLFAKVPIAGQVKTRLAAEIGDEKALAVYLHCLEYSLFLLHESGLDYQIWLNRFSQQRLFDNEPICLQQGTELGEKMHHALSSVLGNEQPAHDKILLMGSDCVELTTHILGKAEKALDHHPLVLIPAKDGGYVLIGCRDHIDARLFHGIDWGTPRVLQQTLAKAMQIGINTRLLNPLRDIDHASDLQHYAAFESYL
jgi:rSAM/selenodomain-associated transferase 1